MSGVKKLVRFESNKSFEDNEIEEIQEDDVDGESFSSIDSNRKKIRKMIAENENLIRNFKNLRKD